MITIIASTNRNNAYSLKIAEFYKTEFEKRNIETNLLDLKDLPIDFIHSALYENSGKNEKFNELRGLVENAEKLFFVIPEYNGSFPGILKAFIDGLNYPNGIKGKKAAMIGISAGNQGAEIALSHFTDILNYLGCHVLASKPKVGAVYKVFVDNEIQNEKMKNTIIQQIEDLIEF